ncbi:MFS transporter, partial [Salmonella enterica subsp. enterica]
RPGRVVVFPGFFFGFPLGVGGRGGGVVGLFAAHPIIFLFKKFCSSLPFGGILTIFFPDNQKNSFF